PVIDVKQRALGAFEQHPLAIANRAMHGEPRVGGERQEPRRQLREQCDVLIDAGALSRSQHAEQRVGPLDALTEHLRRRFEIAEVADPDAAAAVLVLVRGADAATGGADLLALLAGL